MKSLAETKREMIFRELINSHPKPMTVIGIHRSIKKPVATVRLAIKDMRNNNIVIPYEAPHKPGKTQRDKSSRGKSRRPEDLYILENANFAFNGLHDFEYKFAPGCVQYTEEFLRLYPILVNKAIQNRVHKLFVKFVEEVFNTIHNPANRMNDVLSSESGSESLCSNCGFNHEARDLIRAILLHSIDQFEMTDEFIELLEKQHLISDETYSKLKEGSAKINHLVTRTASRLKKLRLLSVNPTNAEDTILFIGIDEAHEFYYGIIKCDIAKNLTSEMIIECDPSIIDARSNGWSYTSITEDDDIRLLNSSLPLPTFSDVKSTISEIMPEHPEDFGTIGNIFFLEGFVTEPPRVVQRYIHGTLVNAIDTKIVGPGGETRLIGHINNETSISEGDCIRIQGAIMVPHFTAIIDGGEPYGGLYGHNEIEDIELRLSPYGSIIKLGHKGVPEIIHESKSLGHNELLRKEDGLVMANVKEFIGRGGVRNSVEVVPALKFYEYFPEFKSFIFAIENEYEYQIKRYNDGSMKYIKISRNKGPEKRPRDEEDEHFLSLNAPAADNSWIVRKLEDAFTKILDKYYS
jgi:hypothetical protein